MNYLATSINESAVIAEKAAETIADVRGKAVVLTENGVKLAQAGEVVFGVGIMTNDEAIAAGADVDVQIKDIGLVHTGATIKKGAELSAGADGAFVTATSGHVAAIALEGAATAGVYIKARLVSYTK